MGITSLENTMRFRKVLSPSKGRNLPGLSGEPCHSHAKPHPKRQKQPHSAPGLGKHELREPWTCSCRNLELWTV